MSATTVPRSLGPTSWSLYEPTTCFTGVATVLYPYNIRQNETKQKQNQENPWEKAGEHGTSSVTLLPQIAHTYVVRIFSSSFGMDAEAAVPELRERAQLLGVMSLWAFSRNLSLRLRCAHWRQLI